MSDFLDLYSNTPKGMPLTLIIIKHPTLGEFNLTDDNIQHAFNGKNYSPYPYKIDFPDESDDSDNSGQITIAKVDDRITSVLRQGAKDITVTITAEYISASGEWSPLTPLAEFKVSNPSISLSTIQAKLLLDNVLEDAFPSALMTNTTCPGIS